MKIKAYRWRQGTHVECFRDPVSQTLIGNRPLADRQREVFGRGGFEVAEVEDLEEIQDREFIVFLDRLYISWPLLKKALKAIRKVDVPVCCRMAMPRNAFTTLTQFTGEQSRVELDDGREAYLFGLYYFRLGSGDSVLAAMAEAGSVAVEPWLKTFTLPFSSRVPTMKDIEIPVTDQVAFEVTSWVHLWLANLYTILVELFGRLRSPAGVLSVLCRCILGLLTAWSLRPFKILVSMAGRLVFCGRGCRIHPTALVEASILGRNVEIGPMCVVRGSILGDNVTVMEQSTIDGSVIGDRVIINQQGMIECCVAYPEAVFNWMQAGIVGRRSFLGRLCRPLDMKFQGSIQVRHRGGLVDTGIPFLGCCIGHGALISSDTRILPGRAIPNDYKILSDYSRYVDEIDEGLPTDQLLLERDGKIGLRAETGSQTTRGEGEGHRREEAPPESDREDRS